MDCSPGQDRTGQSLRTILGKQPDTLMRVFRHISLTVRSNMLSVSGILTMEGVVIESPLVCLVGMATSPSEWIVDLLETNLHGRELGFSFPLGFARP